MSLSPSQRLSSIEDLLLYRLGRLSSVAGAMVVRLCEGGYGITRREWAVVAQLYENGSLPPSAVAERMHRDRARTSRTLTALGHKQLVLRTIPANDRRSALMSLMMDASSSLSSRSACSGKSCAKKARSVVSSRPPAAARASVPASYASRSN